MDATSKCTTGRASDKGKLTAKLGNRIRLDPCVPFDVSRAYDEAAQYPEPGI